MRLNCTVEAITVLLADDNLIVREGVRALLRRDPTIDVVGVAGDYDELISQAIALAPQVLVTDIRMPPTFTDEGIEGAKEVRKRLPGTGVVVLSQYDSPEYAVELLSSGAAGYAYLLKDRVADSDRLARAIREVATGGSMLDPEIVRALVSPARTDGALTPDQEDLLRQVAEGRPVKAIATSLGSTPESVNDAIESLFLALANGASAGQADALQRLRMLHAAILDREEQGQTLSRLLPGGLAAAAAHRQGSRQSGTDRPHRTTDRHRSDVRCARIFRDRRGCRPGDAGRSAQRAPKADECCDPWRGGNRHAVRGGRRHGCFRSARSAAGSRHRCRARRDQHARAPARIGPGLGRAGPAPVRARASACRPVRSPRPCSAAANGSNTPWSATR